MAELNIVEKANKVLSFRKMIRATCQKEGLEYPSDEKIHEYITSGLGMDVDEFMTAYKEKVGIFKDPFVDFKNTILEKWHNCNYELTTMPSDDEMRSYVAENGYNVKGFARHHIINSYEGIEKDTLIATLKLKSNKLIKLWNIFVEESAKYGEDSYIYDLDNPSEMEFLGKHMRNDEMKRVYAIKNKGIRYMQWFSLNDNSIKGRSEDDVLFTIVGYWDDIFPRIMLYPYAYQFKVEKYAEGDGSTYFDDVFFPILTEKLGYHIDGDKGTITKIK